MAKLPRYDLTKNQKTEKWELEDSSGKIVKKFDTKADATAGGALSKAIGKVGGTVKIHLENGKFEEERTFPRKDDPAKSPG